MNAVEFLRNALAGVVEAEEAIEDGDSSYAHTLLVQLEADLVSSLAALSMEAV